MTTVLTTMKTALMMMNKALVQSKTVKVVLRAQTPMIEISMKISKACQVSEDKNSIQHLIQEIIA